MPVRVRHSGGDYIMPARVNDYHKKIRRKVGRRLKYCGGNVVVLFDELQKAAPGTLDGESRLLRLCNACKAHNTCRSVIRASSRWFGLEQCLLIDPCVARTKRFVLTVGDGVGWSGVGRVGWVVCLFSFIFVRRAVGRLVIFSLSSVCLKTR